VRKISQINQLCSNTQSVRATLKREKQNNQGSRSMTFVRFRSRLCL